VTAKWVPPDANDLVKRYLAGESEQALAESFGVSRAVIRRVLLEAGIRPRNRSAGMHTRMAQTSPEERRRLASAAHDAVRGKAKTADFLAAKALGIERIGAAHGNASVAELILADMLREAGREVIHQKAIGPYNVDLTTGPVAVEVLGGGWHRSKKHGERLRYILNAGWDVIYVWVDGRNFPLATGAGEYVAAHCEFRDRNPAAPRCYRVIRGGGEFVAEGSADSDDIPDVIPISYRPDVRLPETPYGFCHCGCGERTTVVSSKNAGKGFGVGQPRLFRHGHYQRLRGRHLDAS